jgi:hypothetical protein
MDEVELMAYLTTKLSLNFNNADFMVLTAGKHYTGGNKRPNWRLTPKPNSPFWYADKIVWLHDGLPIEEPEPEPEPEGNWQRLFPTRHLVIETNNSSERYTELYLDDAKFRTIVLTYDADRADQAYFDIYATRACAKRGDEVRFYNASGEDIVFRLSSSSESNWDEETDVVTNYNVNVKYNGRRYFNFYKLLSGGTMRFVLADTRTEIDPEYPNDSNIFQSWYAYGVTIVEEWGGNEEENE